MKFVDVSGELDDDDDDDSSKKECMMMMSIVAKERMYDDVDCSKRKNV